MSAAYVGDPEFLAWLQEELGISNLRLFGPDEMDEWYEIYLEEELTDYDFFDW